MTKLDNQTKGYQVLTKAGFVSVDSEDEEWYLPGGM